MGSVSAMIAGFMLVLTRTGALVVSAPVLGIGTGFVGYRITLIGFLSLLLYSTGGGPVQAEPLELALMALRETVIGVFFGLLVHLALLVVRTAGELVGQEMGFLVARQVDPNTGVGSSLVTGLYENLFLLFLLALDGHHWLLRSLARSFQYAPIGRLEIGEKLAPTAVAMFSEMFRAGLVFAAPVLVFLMLVSAVIGILARAVPSMNVMEIGFTLRILVALGAIFLFAPLLDPALRNLDQQLLSWLDRGLAAL